MPFQIAPRFPVSSFLSINLSGLLLIKPDANGTSCSVYVNHKEPHHKLKIFLTIDRPDDAQVRKVLQLGPLTKEFAILVAGVHAGKVFAYKPSTNFDRNLAVDDRRDLRWSVNLETGEFNNEGLRLDPSAMLQRLTINSGVFYTAERTDESSVRVTKSLTQTTDITSIASVISASLEISHGEQIVLSWENKTPIILPRTGDLLGTTYRLDVTNEPPDDFAETDELKHYYEVLQKANGSAISNKWSLTIGPKDPNSAEKTDEIPCMPITLEP